MSKNGGAANGKMTKKFPVFDCDAHINDPLKIWEYVEPKYKDLVQQSYWRNDKQAILNGKKKVIGGARYEFFPGFNPICISGPGMTKPIKRKLIFTPLSEEQKDYLEHQGAYDPHARIKDLDLMGIDAVMVIPTLLVGHYPFIENADGAYALARAYNNWADDFCSVNRERLHAAGWLPVQNAEYAVDELRRLAKMGVRVALVRPIDAQGNYPNKVYPSWGGINWDKVYRAFEETDTVVGMHTFPTTTGVASTDKPMFTPGELIDLTAHGQGMAQGINSQTLSFIYEATVWLAQVLLSGFLERYPKLKMSILESNSTWLPGILERLDRYFMLYASQRTFPVKRLPSEAFYEQMFISFESDETPMFRQWDKFENVAVWASDSYHHDGSDSWSAISEMNDVEVPEAVQAKMLGGNAYRMYRIEPKVFVHEQMPIERPGWFPKPAELDEFVRVQKDPKLAREYMAKMMAARAGH